MENRGGISLQDYLTVLRRRRFSMSWVFLAVMLGASAVTWIVPQRYRAAAFIRIQAPEIRDGLLTSAVDPASTEARIDLMRDRVIRNPNLEPIIEEFSLYAEYPAEERPSLMRSDIDTPRVLNSDNPRVQFLGPETIGFEVAFLHASPEISQGVANRLAALFLEENVESRTEVVAETSSFLAEQAEVLKVELARTEAALAEFKRRNNGSLPENTDLNLQLLDRAQRDIDGIEREIRTLQERKNLLVAELAQTSASATLYSETGEPILGTEERLELLRREYVTMVARYSLEHPDLLRVRREIELLSQEEGATFTADVALLQLEIEARRAELAELRQRYAEDHPNVSQLQRTIDGMVEQLGTAPDTLATSREPNNPEYIRLQLQLEAVDTELGALREDREELRARLLELETRIGRAPETEREAIMLTRDYEIARQDYNEIRQKQAEAERAVVIEDQQRAEHYVLQRRAPLPTSPAQPNHATIMAIGLFLALTAAIGFGLMKEAFDTTIRGPKDLRAMIDAAPIAVIPSVPNRNDVLRRALSRVVLGCFFGAVAFIGISAIA